MNAASSDNSLDLMPAADPERGATLRNPPDDGSLAAQLPRSALTRGILVRAPTILDVHNLATLFSEMQRYYRRPVTDGQAIEAATLACQPVTGIFDPRVLIAMSDHVIAGSIVLNVTFPAFELSRSLYIRDLYVAISMRRHGVGQALVQAAAYLTYDQGFSALDWTTETNNTAARQMYESCGARVLPRTYYRLARENMSPAANSGN